MTCDCYFLIENRNTNYLLGLLDWIVPDREQTTDLYVLKINENKEFVSYIELMHYLELNEKVTFDIYLDNKDNDSVIYQVNLVYTDDGKVVLGCGIKINELTELKGIRVQENYNRVMKFLNSKHSCLTIEEVCPQNSNDFESFCLQRNNLYR